MYAAANSGGGNECRPGYIPTGIYRIPTNPEDFYLDDFDSMAQDMMAYAVGPTGATGAEIREELA